ncbi:hypothetical protein F6X54_10225 [Micromonospora aurantiaca]|uniref:Uncharacterized protein n=1 Tax=Micromonospora aurantiaca (nom. illeg.) TaxID=47850 RepID=A0ABQ6UIW6_9ACTN|nr:hypothetical protein [Micromonospora aurantiaca]KAB1116850.1 hypothetical protein F6X54_10225 [Micromonospora aurantiaca]
MPLHIVAVYHNADSRFLPYEPDHALTQVISHCRHLPTRVAPEQSADWAFAVFNADLGHLEAGRATPDGEATFLLACTYRLLRLRSLSTGDVIAVTADGHTTWLACEFTGWRRIDTPTNLTGQPLTAETVYQHLRRGRHA